ncbi:hypothetical protein HH310_37805 [Actinoplanes sp. TBRC 11911]|uniref:phosphorylase family protein n=1 Tax=Actinoplanes sp. TBRC 11911 TaxID=2729386 RepID=UPI00145C9B50|nr:hypothetical protein [Actinoplanes sp. TBRC 11911]NMO56917.1 hypothetical protein [Actinoplanes sp. TBRC 11911]
MDPDIGVDDPSEVTAGRYSLVLLAPRRSDATALRRGLRRAAQSRRISESEASDARPDEPEAAGREEATAVSDAAGPGEAVARAETAGPENDAGEARPPEAGEREHAAKTPAALVVRTGVGPRRSRRAVRDDHLILGRTIAVVGIGRALAARVKPGDVVVADQVRTDALTEGVVPPTRLVPSAPRIAALLRQHGLTVHVGSVISTDNRVNDTVRDRLAMTRALIADRESAWLLAACGKIPIACVRVAGHRRVRGWRRTARTLRIVSATLTEWASS